MGQICLDYANLFKSIIRITLKRVSKDPQKVLEIHTPSSSFRKYGGVPLLVYAQSVVENVSMSGFADLYVL
jgi:hypothetical protein